MAMAAIVTNGRFVRTFFCLFSSLALLFGLTGCTGGGGGGTPYSGQVNAPQSDNIRVGDELLIRITGVPDADQQVLAEPVPEDGMISMPLVGRFRAAGRTTTELKYEIEEAYKSRRIYTNPTITIALQQRFVNVIGEVRQNGNIPFRKDLTALGAISAAGGFTEYANKKSVLILRDGKTISFNASAALNNPAVDIPLRAGDTVQVKRTIF